MKKILIYSGVAILSVFALFFVWKYLIWGETFKTDYENSIPPGLPRDIPLVDGSIEKSVRAINIYGEEAYQVIIQTDQPLSELADFYKKEFTKAGNPETSLEKINTGGVQEIYGGDARFGDHELLVEIYQSRVDSKNEVNLSVIMDAYKE